MSGLADDAPLLAAYLRALDSGLTPFTIPGHKRRGQALDPGLGRVVDGDVPLFGGLDTVGQAGGHLAHAEALAAAAWGADWLRMSTGGSTHANQALLLAIAEDGARVVLSRSAHRSTVTGLALAGLDPVWVPPRVHPTLGVPLGLDPDDVAAALAATPGARAVLTVEPAYTGAISDVAALAEVAHAAGALLIVDAAWGAHLGWAPVLPPHALSCGADAVVTSVHKALPGVSGAALAMARTGPTLTRDRLEEGFEATHTTSPAGAVLASCDAVRALVQSRGNRLLTDLVGRVASARGALVTAVPGLVVLDPGFFPAGRFDPAKLVVLTASVGADGRAVESDLLAQGLPVEQADQDTVVAIVTLADDDATVARLVSALAAALLARSGTPRSPAPVWSQVPTQVVSPRAASQGRRESVPATAAVGRVCAELVAPYPPGVPVLAPGELVTAAAVEHLRRLAAAGTRIAYAADPTLETLRVLTAASTP